MSYRTTALTAVFTLWLIFPSSAMAYIGPGGGMSAIGVFLALVAGFILAILGFVWYPIKRMIKKFRLANRLADRKTVE